MAARLPIVAGLAAGVSAAVLLIVALVAFAPEPGSGPASASPAASPGLSPSPAVTAPPDRSPRPSGPLPTGSAATGAFHIGEPAPRLQVPQVGGGTIDLANLRGQPVWVNFMATWCPPCRDEFPVMNGFATRYAEDGLVILAIDVREDEGTVASFAESLGATFPLGLDSDGAAQQDWDALALPVHFWVDADGIVRDGALGGIGQDLMADALRKIMPDVDVRP